MMLGGNLLKKRRKRNLQLSDQDSLRLCSTTAGIWTPIIACSLVEFVCDL